MKYKLLKDLPWYKAWTVITTNEKWEFYYYDAKSNPDFFEEVKEAKTIFDIKEWDTYYLLDENAIEQYCVATNIHPYFNQNNIISCFLTEREAKRNKLLRELATRIDKWLPEDNEIYITAHREKPTEWVWSYDNLDILYYHQWIVFRNEEEYNKWITPENADLLFNI
jgi:hypothetical protein